MVKHIKILITEEQLYKLINEGADWKPNDDGTLNLSINTSSNDADSNRIGSTAVDTRVFGTKHDILYGDDTFEMSRHRRGGGRLTNFNTSYNRAIKKIAEFNAVRQWVINGCHGDVIKLFNLEGDFAESVLAKLKISPQELLNWCNKSLSRLEFEQNLGNSVYNRLNKIGDNDRTFRYQQGIIPKTNVPFIALFTMQDFNFHNALKHGTIKSGKMSDDIFKVPRDERKSEKSRKGAKINVTFDDSQIPFNIENFFSQPSANDSHYKKQYGYKDPNYTSVNQFLDKSIIYAARVLKEIGFTPTHIVSAPSSSKFNKYYCTNLANKLGIKYVENFFVKDAINIKIKDVDINEMVNNGFSEEEIMKIKKDILGIVKYELKTRLQQILFNFIDYYHVYFDGGRGFDEMKELVYDYTIKEMTSQFNKVEDLTSKYVGAYISRGLLNRYYNEKPTLMQIEEPKLYTKEEMDNRILRSFIHTVQYRIGLPKFNKVMNDMIALMQEYIDALMSPKGLKFDVRKTSSKITDINKRFRPYLSDIYLVANEMLYNGTLHNEYQNAKIILFDEDVNSGGTLMLITKALLDKLPATSEKNLLGLVNAYSSSGN